MGHVASPPTIFGEGDVGSGFPRPQVQSFVGGVQVVGGSELELLALSVDVDSVGHVSSVVLLALSVEVDSVGHVSSETNEINSYNSYKRLLK